MSTIKERRDRVDKLLDESPTVKHIIRIIESINSLDSMFLDENDVDEIIEKINEEIRELNNFWQGRFKKYCT